jgi:hypothetical protein
MAGLLTKITRLLFYKKIPKNLIKTANVNCRLDFSKAKFEYYIPRFKASWTSMSCYAMSFLSFNGDLTVLQVGPIADECDNKFRKAETLEEGLKAIYDFLGHPEIAKISYFKNPSWTGLLAEYITETKAQKSRCATVIYAFYATAFIFTLVVPAELSDNLFVSEDIHEDIIGILKTFISSKELIDKYGLPKAQSKVFNERNSKKKTG